MMSNQGVGRHSALSGEGLLEFNLPRSKKEQDKAVNDT